MLHTYDPTTQNRAFNFLALHLLLFRSRTNYAIQKEAEKRDRRRAEATATAPVLLGGWGKGSDLRPSDELLIRKTIRGGWDTPQPVRDAIVRDIVPAALDPIRPRLTLTVIRTVIDMVKDNQGRFDRRPSRRRR